MPHVASFTEAMLVSVAAALMTLLSFVPALIGAIIILIVGWFLADLVAKLVETLLRRIGFETVSERAGVGRFISMTGARNASASHVMAEIVKWFIRLVFLEMAAQALHLTAVTTLINQILLFIPNLIVALVVVMVGVMIANFVGGLVRGGAAEMGMSSPNLMAGAARVAIIVLSVIVALNQVGIATTIVNALFMAIVGAIALALGLSFGLGGREVAGQVWQNWYGTARDTSQKLEQKAAVAEPARASQPASGTSYEPAPAAGPESGYTPPPPAPYKVRHDRPSTAG